jgi:tRNA G18 (ribose-2'-O)-methylase SpoU
MVAPRESSPQCGPRSISEIPFQTAKFSSIRASGNGGNSSALSLHPPAGGRVFTTAELRQHKSSRPDFLSLPRRPITIVLDRLRQNYNIGAIFRLCDAFLVERLVICGTQLDLRNRKLVQAARGTHRWVPCTIADSAGQMIVAAKAAGSWVVAAEQTTAGVMLDQLKPAFPAVLILGSESTGISQDAIDQADCAVTIPMLGMANSLNVSTAAAIILYELGLAADRLATTSTQL